MKDGSITDRIHGNGQAMINQIRQTLAHLHHVRRKLLNTAEFPSEKFITTKYLSGPTGDYIWLQDNEDPPSTGTMVSATNITIYPNDIICITIYRHLKVYNRAENPRLNLVTDGGSHKQGLLWSYSYDAWDTVSLVCGQDESCCLTYPCTGYVRQAIIFLWQNDQL